MGKEEGDEKEASSMRGEDLMLSELTFRFVECEYFTAGSGNEKGVLAGEKEGTLYSADTRSSSVSLRPELILI